jgi:GNAT superfamily N-acetyltransferase
VPLEIRQAARHELPAVGELCVAAYAPFLSEDGHYMESLRDAERRFEHAELLVAVEDDQIVGTVTFVPEGGPLGEIAQPDEAEFRMLAVDPAAQGRGVGSALVQRILDESRRNGHTGIVCSTLPEMRAAHRVYERAGFRRAPERDWSPFPGVRLIAFAVEL